MGWSWLTNVLYSCGLSCSIDDFLRSKKNFKQVFVPVGFAHGFLTLEDNCEISYKVSNPYDHYSDVSLSVFDKELNIELPCSREEITLSEKDAQGENIKAISKIF